MLICYMNHVSSSMVFLTKVKNEWKTVCEQMQQGAVLDKKSDMVKNAVTGWQQLIKHLAINLSMVIGEPVSIALPRSRSPDVDLNPSNKKEQSET